MKFVVEASLQVDTDEDFIVVQLNTGENVRFPIDSRKIGELLLASIARRIKDKKVPLEKSKAVKKGGHFSPTSRKRKKQRFNRWLNRQKQMGMCIRRGCGQHAAEGRVQCQMHHDAFQAKRKATLAKLQAKRKETLARQKS